MFAAFGVAVAAASSAVHIGIGITSTPGSANTTATQVLLDTVAYPDARCLDGSAGVMYIRPGWGSGTHVWNLFHEGGGSCHSVEDCADRAKTRQGSSTQWEQTIDIAGKYASGPYFSNDPAVNPLLYNANHVYMIYCDGGAFSGDNYTTTTTTATAAAAANNNYSNKKKGANTDTVHLHFRGQRIIRGIVSQLGRDTGFKEATDVVISGCSEGGVATYAHIDWMANLVRHAVPTVQKIAGLADSGFYPGTGSPYSHVPRQEFLYTAQNASGCLNPRCLAANRATPWACLVADMGSKFIETPTFVLQSVFDTNQLGTAGCSNSACAVPYMQYLNASVLNFVTSRRGPHNVAVMGGYVDMCSRHCNNEPPIDGYTSLSAFAEWFSGWGGVASSSTSTSRRLWVQQTAMPFNSKPPYCATCCK